MPTPTDPTNAPDRPATRDADGPASLPKRRSTGLRSLRDANHVLHRYGPVLLGYLLLHPPHL